MSAAGVIGPQPAQAAPAPSRYGNWTFGGSSTNYTGSVDLGTGFPAIAMTTDSRTPPGASAANPSGAISTSAVIRAESAFGATFGSSQGQQYLSLRPRADGNAQSAGSPSTTTYTFAGPTPSGTWGVVLGDIDAETLTVAATDPAGNAVAGADLGVTAFNYCGAPANATCAGGLTTPSPTVDVAATSVTAAEPLCPPTNCNTSGAALSVQPTVPIATLAIASGWRQGFPSYQTWFATRTVGISGRVTAPCALATSPTARLLDGGGNLVTSSPTGSDGTFSFPGLAAGNYRVDVDPTTLPAVASTQPVDVDATNGDTTTPDVAVRTSVTVTGTVQRSTSAATAVVADLPVTLTASDGTDRRTTTDADGRYTFAGVTDGRYRISVAPDGQDTITPREQDVAVACEAVDVGTFTAAAAPGPSSPPATSTSSAPSTSEPATSASPDPPDSGTSSGGPVDGNDGQRDLADTGSSLRMQALLALLAIGAGLLITGAVIVVRPVGSPERSRHVLGRRRRSSRHQH